MSSEPLPWLTPASIPELGYLSPETVADAISAIASLGSRGKIIAGGSDLLHLMKRDSLVPFPDVIVDIKGIEQLRSLEFDAGRGMTLGSLVTIATLETDSTVAGNYPLLSQAAEDISSPQVRNVATVGGALCQQVWCPFLRNGLRCWRAGGYICYATQDGADNRYYHSIMGGNDCYAVHPSDLAVALEALDASVVISGPYGTKTVRIDEFLPGNVRLQGVFQSHILASNELVTSVRLPKPSPGARHLYLKTRIRNAFDFAIASLALALNVEGATINSSRVVFGGIAPAPYRDTAVEKMLEGREASSVSVEDVAATALSSASPLQNNGYKVEVAKGLLVEGLAQLLA